jgi:hypothetical protein
MGFFVSDSTDPNSLFGDPEALKILRELKREETDTSKQKKVFERLTDNSIDKNEYQKLLNLMKPDNVGVPYIKKWIDTRQSLVILEDWEFIDLIKNNKGDIVKNNLKSIATWHEKLRAVLLYLINRQINNIPKRIAGIDNDRQYTQEKKTKERNKFLQILQPFLINLRTEIKQVQAGGKQTRRVLGTRSTKKRSTRKGTRRH